MNTLQLRQTKGREGAWVALAIADVLARVPGENVTEKCKRIGVSRQAYYSWIAGKSRPSVSQSIRLAKLTHLSASKIRGWIVHEGQVFDRIRSR